MIRELDEQRKRGKRYRTRVDKNWRKRGKEGKRDRQIEREQRERVHVKIGKENRQESQKKRKGE